MQDTERQSKLLRSGDVRRRAAILLNTVFAVGLMIAAAHIRQASAEEAPDPVGATSTTDVPAILHLDIDNRVDVAARPSDDYSPTVATPDDPQATRNTNRADRANQDTLAPSSVLTPRFSVADVHPYTDQVDISDSGQSVLTPPLGAQYALAPNVALGGWSRAAGLVASAGPVDNPRYAFGLRVTF